LEIVSFLLGSVCAVPAPLLIDSKTWTVEARAHGRRVRRWLSTSSFHEHLHHTLHKSLVSRAGRPERKKKRDEVVHDLRDETFTLCFFYFSNLLFFKLKAPNLL
jgi:hypothetical protein